MKSLKKKKKKKKKKKLYFHLNILLINGCY